MYNIKNINEFDKVVNLIRSLHTGKEQLVSMSFVESCIDMMNIDYTNSNQKIFFQNPQYGTEMIFIYNKLKEYHTDDVINNMLYTSTDNYFYFDILKNKFGFKNVLHTSFQQLKNHNVLYDIIIRCTPGSTSDFVTSFNLLNPNGKLIYSHLAEIILNKKETQNTDKSIRIEFKNIINNFKTKIRLFKGQDEFKSKFETLLSTIIIEKIESNDIEVLYNQFDSTTNWINVNSIFDIWMHGDSIVSNIFECFNTKTKSYSKIFRRYFKELKKHYKTKQSDDSDLLKKYKFWVRLNHIQSNLFGPTYYSFFTQSQLQLKSKNIILNSNQLLNDSLKEYAYGFETKIHAQNFIKLLQTKFMKFYLSMYKIDANLNRNETRNLPEFDLTMEWTDELIYDHLQIPKKYRAFIENFTLIQ